MATILLFIFARHVIENDENDEFWQTTFTLFRMTLETASTVLISSFGVLSEDKLVMWEVSIASLVGLAIRTVGE